jgi:hypothetical protein
MAFAAEISEKEKGNKNMFETDTKAGFSLKAYKGSLMTLLTMNLKEKPADGSFAGFTLFYKNKKGKRPIQNLLNFEGKEMLMSSEVAPIQLFRWIHFPGSYSLQTGNFAGKYAYEATPRYFDAKGNLLPLDSSKTAQVKIDVETFRDGKISVGFTRAFVKSQAFANRYGAKQKLLPKGDWMFDPNQKAGTNATFGDYTYEDIYAWLGFNARIMIYDLLREALGSSKITVEMFAYDFNDPVVADLCLKLAEKGRIKIILDSAALHHGEDEDKLVPASNKKGKLIKEDDFEKRFNAKATAGAEMFRCKFGRFAHCKEIILKKDGEPYKVLTGSTNFSYTGLYVNANHVLVFDDAEVAKYYSDIFNVCWKVGNAPAFRKTEFAGKEKRFSGADLPATEINVSPHDGEYAKQLIDSITTHVTDKKTESVLFSVMEMGKTSSGSLIPALRSLHKNDAVFTYGVTDNSSGEISLFKPGRKTGLLVDAKKADRELPPPFKKEFQLGLSHAIHHKFVVTNFNKKDARVYCGSSNLALGGEKDNSDNLVCIKDTDVATVFAIEALRLTDHYNYRSRLDDEAPGANKETVKLDKTGKWVEPFYDENDIRFVEREVFA